MNGSSNAWEPWRRPRRDGRHRRPTIVLLSVLLVGLTAAAAIGEDLPEKPAYVEMLRGDRAREAGDWPAAMAAYQKALTLFERLRRERPDYKAAAIEYRMDYCRAQVSDLLKQPGAETPEADASAAGRLAALQQSLEQLEQERRGWEQERAALVRERDEALKAAERNRREAESARAQLDDVEQKNRALEADLRARRDAVPLAEARQLKRALEESESARSSLARHVDKAEQRIASLTARIEAMTSERKPKEMARSPAADVAAYESEIARLSRELSAARSALARAEARAESMAARLALAEQELAAARAASASVEPAAPDTIRELAAARGECDRLRAEAAALQSKLDAAEAERADDRARLQELARALKSASSSDAEVERLRRDAAQAAADRDAAREQIAALRRANAQLDEARLRAEQMASAAPPADDASDVDAVRRLEARLQAIQAKLHLREQEARAAQQEAAALRKELARVQAAAPLAGTTPSSPPADTPADGGRQPAAPALSDPANADRLAALLAEAAAAFASNQVDRALVLYDQALVAEPADPTALTGFCRANLAKGNLRSARAAAERMIDLTPDLADGYHALGLVEAREGNRRAAVRAFARAVDIDPGRPLLHRDLAIALYKAGRIADAIAEYREVIRLSPDDGQSHFNLATMLMMTKDPPVEEARLLYERALALGEPPDAALESKLRP